MGTGDQPGTRILVGVDGSADGQRAAEYGMRAAEASGSGLWLVHAVDEAALIGEPWGLVATTDALRAAGEAALKESSDRLVAEGFDAARISTEVQFGRPAEVLARLSASAGLVVVGRRAISGLERMFVGSTSVGLAGRTQCPLVVISAASTPQRTGGLGVVGVALAGWPPHSAALEWGVREAEARGARLRVVHVVAEGASSNAAILAGATADLEQHLAPLRADHAGTVIDLEVAAGSPIDELVALSRSVDLLIIGVHPGGWVLSGLARGVLAHAHCPVGLTG